MDLDGLHGNNHSIMDTKLSQDALYPAPAAYISCFNVRLLILEFSRFCLGRELRPYKREE